jgi:hypothetical protein
MRITQIRNLGIYLDILAYFISFQNIMRTNKTPQGLMPSAQLSDLQGEQVWGVHVQVLAKAGDHCT